MRKFERLTKGAQVRTLQTALSRLLGADAITAEQAQEFQRHLSAAVEEEYKLMKEQAQQSMTPAEKAKKRQRMLTRSKNFSNIERYYQYQNMTQKEIAYELNISISTVSRILKKIKENQQ